jgi:type IV pilus assembly protein PilC
MSVTVESINRMSSDFAAMLRSGRPLSLSLLQIANTQRDEQLRDILLQVRHDILNGMPLSQAMARHPGAFDRNYLMMVRHGETAGNLDEMLAEYTRPFPK